MSYKPDPIVQQAKLSEVIAQAIMVSIERGELKPNDKLPPERELAERFKVSRTSLREALRALEIIGVIESRVGDGSFITDVSPDNVYRKVNDLLSLLKEASSKEIMEADEILQIEIVRLAATRATKDDIDVINHIIESMNSQITCGEDGLELDNEFHIAISRATHNRVLVQLMSHLVAIKRDKVWNYIRRKILGNPADQKRYFDEHNAIYQAIKEGDPDKAVSMMQKHIHRVKADLKKT